MKKWFSDRLLSVKIAASYVRGIFTWKLFVAYLALFGLCGYLEIGVIPFLGLLVIVALIDCLSYSQGIRVERDIKQRIHS